TRAMIASSPSPMLEMSMGAPAATLPDALDWRQVGLPGPWAGRWTLGLRPSARLWTLGLRPSARLWTLGLRPSAWPWTLGPGPSAWLLTLGLRPWGLSAGIPGARPRPRGV